MNNLGRVIKGAVTALGCLIFAMMFFAGVIALSDYSVAQSHNQPGAAEGATLAEIIMLVAFLGGSALLVWIARTLIWSETRPKGTENVHSPTRRLMSRWSGSALGLAYGRLKDGGLRGRLVVVAATLALVYLLGLLASSKK